MPLNLTIHRAKYQAVCGEIEFTNDRTDQRYRLLFSSTDGLEMAEIPRRAGPPVFRKVTCGEVLAIVNQGNFLDWTWRSFVATWEAWSEDYRVGHDDGAREGVNDPLDD